MELIRNFKNLDKNDAAIAGGKGASLGEMTKAGIPVPPGFVVLSGAFEQFIRETDLIQEIEAILHKVDHKEIHTVEAASEQIRELILNAAMPKDIASEITKRFKELDTKYVAVRSSATAEDGKDHAWAGQLESYLNTTEEDVMTKVKLCWSSLFTPRAIFYRFEKGLHSTKISVAVVIQKMIESEVSGIAFSVHPVTEDRNQLIIEAGFGLGEAIVSGSVTPDSYVIEKEPRNILDINVSTQERALYRSEKTSKEHGNNEWVTIPEPKASSQVLTKEQILELSKIILGIENHYGFPCDIEWAFEKGKFYIVQSRPITTLSKQSEKSPEITNKLFGKFPTLLTYDENPKVLDEYREYIFANKKWYPKGIKSHLLLMLPQGIAAAAGVSSVHRIGFKLGVATYEDEYMNWSYDPRDFFAIGQDIITRNRNKDNWVSVYKSLFWEETEKFKQIVDRIYWQFDSSDNSKIKENFIAVIDAAIRAQSYGYITEVFTQTEDYWVTDYVKSIAPDLSSEEISILLQPKSISFVKEYQKRLKAADSKTKLEKLIKEFFWVKGSYFVLPELSVRVMEEERSVLDYSEQEFSNKKKILDKVGNEELNRFIESVETFISIQDERKANVLRLNYALQKLCKCISRNLKDVKLDELMSLSPKEVVLLLDDKVNVPDIKKVIKERNKKSVWLCTNEGYFLTSDKSKLDEFWSIFDVKKDGQHVKGYKASGGKVVGTVKVVFSENDFDKVNKGDILVTSMTRPEFMPILEKAAAFVTNEGGITCHAAIVSREMNKPCIIGTKNATQVLKDGDMVEVDADNGIARKI